MKPLLSPTNKSQDSCVFKRYAPVYFFGLLWYVSNFTAFQGLSADRPQTGELNPCATPAFFSADIPTPRLINYSAVTSVTSYLAFKKIEEPGFSSQSHLKSVASKGYPGFFEFVPKPTPNLTLKNYNGPYISCSKQLEKPSLGPNGCGMFIVIYEPTQPGLPPIVSVKGTSNWEDVIEDVGGFGSGYLRDIIHAFNPLTQTPTLSPVYFKAFTRLFKTSKTSPLFSGHSLGGSLTRNMAEMYASTLEAEAKRKGKKAETMTLNVLPYAPLSSVISKEKLLKKIREENEALKNPLHTRTEGPHIRTLNIVTYDEPLQWINEFFDAYDENNTLVLPSHRRIDPFGRTGFIPSPEGHKINTLIRDINFARNPESEKKLAETYRRVMGPEVESANRTFRFNNAPTPPAASLSYREGYDPMTTSYDVEYKTLRGKRIVPEILSKILSPKTETAVGRHRVIGTYTNQDGTSREVLKDPDCIYLPENIEELTESPL